MKEPDPAKKRAILRSAVVQIVDAPFNREWTDTVLFSSHNTMGLRRASTARFSDEMAVVPVNLRHIKDLRMLADRGLSPYTHQYEEIINGIVDDVLHQVYGSAATGQSGKT
jgi:hypothetical protein